jgi:hypothetical protein
MVLGLDNLCSSCISCACSCMACPHRGVAAQKAWLRKHPKWGGVAAQMQGGRGRTKNGRVPTESLTKSHHLRVSQFVERVERSTNIAHYMCAGEAAWRPHLPSAGVHRGFLVGKISKFHVE